MSDSPAPSPTRTVGLTGGIACGKSTVARMLAQRGIPVIDADQVSRDVVAPGSPGLTQVLAAFGAHLRRPDGSLDRPALGAIVMADAQARKRLEAITHPLIGAEVLRRLAQLAAQGHPHVIVEAAVMVEAGSFRRYDGVMLVRCPPDIQRQRLAARQGWDAAKVQRWIDSQMPLDEKARVLTEAAAQGGPPVTIVVNDGDQAELALAVDRAWQQLCRALETQLRT